jgi:Mrp family chromosome partitioning ATPase
VSSAARISSISALPHAARSGAPHPMKTSGIEEFKSVLRRSALLIIAAVLLGSVVVNVVRQLGGPKYRADAQVLLNNNNLSSAALGLNLGYQDPARQDQAEQNLVNSPQLYRYTAQRTGGRLGTAGQLMAETSASVANNVVSFTASTDNATRSRRVVNAVASAYPPWRAQVSVQAVDAAIAQVQSQIDRVGRTPDLSKQLQQLQVLKTLGSGDTLFVERATSSTKTAPKPVIDTLLGAMIGLIIALLVVGARELFDTTVRTESDVEDALDAPVLAAIESLPRRLRTGVLGSEGGRFNDEYELLAANIAQAFDGHRGTVQLAVTSALPGEGKTTTASNLAAALSRRGAAVVLADFDLRKPSVSEFVGIPKDAVGVSDLLAGAVDLRSVMWLVSPNGEGVHVEADDLETASLAQARVSKSGSSRKEGTEPAAGTFTVMPGGFVREESGAGFAQLPALLDKLPPEADFVVIDTPPALVVSGMAELARSVDAVIVVVRHGFVHRRRLRALGRQARSWRARLLGAVLNDCPADEGYLNYYYGRP